MLVIDAETIVVVSIGNDQVAHSEDNIVSRSLLQRTLIDAYGRGLALHQTHRSAIRAMHHDVGPLRQLIQHQGLFHRDQRSGTAQIVHQMIDEMLAHPLLWREYHPLAPDVIEHLRTCGPLLSFEAMVR